VQRHRNRGFLLLAALGCCTWPRMAQEADSPGETMATIVQHIKTPTKPENLKSTIDCSEMRRPTTSLELMLNLKKIYDCDLSLSIQFYREDNLETIFGGRRIDKFPGNPGEFLWDIDTLRKHGESVKNFGASTAVLGKFLLDKKGHASGVISSHIAIGFSYDPTFTGLTAKTLFGAPDEVVDPYKLPDYPPPNPHRESWALMRKTNPLGNMAMIYHLKSTTSTYKLYILLNGDGTIQRTSLSIGGS
jgi:hypothetical protein